MPKKHFLKLIYDIGDPHQGPLYRETVGVGPMLYRQAFCMITRGQLSLRAVVTSEVRQRMRKTPAVYSGRALHILSDLLCHFGTT